MQQLLVKVKQNLESAGNGFSEFASENTVLTFIELAFWPQAWSW